jgi:predicted membrane channel-forming protein YqfA (hemolysin III family)
MGAADTPAPGARAAAASPPGARAGPPSPPPAHWHDIIHAASGRLLRCRRAGAPAGSFCHTPWWHCVLHDKYERVNFWSHAAPGSAFATLAAAAATGAAAGGAPLALFGACAAATHLLSALTHVWPDSHALEKCDHLGITATIAGTCMSALAASRPAAGVPGPLLALCAALVGAAFLRPLPRTVGFVVCGAAMVALYGSVVMDANLCAQICMYVSGAVFFIRNAGHGR